MNGLLEYPQYSRPEEWHGKKVPPILLSGDHAKVDAWRLEQSLERTRQRRPELYEAYMLEHPPKPPKRRRRRHTGSGAEEARADV
jgi:tRNA (guanine37-N1)-methyltransferase